MQSMRCVITCIAQGIGVTLENPHSSLMWFTKAALAVKELPTTDDVVLDYCRFGTAYRKRTRLLVNGVDLTSLRRLCKCKKPHITLSGWGEKSRSMSTKDTAAYPELLCREWSELIAAELA